MNTPQEEHDESIRFIGRMALELSRREPQEKYRRVLKALSIVMPTAEEREAALRLHTSLRDADTEQLKFEKIIKQLTS